MNEIFAMKAFHSPSEMFFIGNKVNNKKNYAIGAYLLGLKFPLYILFPNLKV